MVSSFERRRIELGERMRALRERTGLTGRELAVAVGWNAPKLSKLETGKQTASHEDLDAWLAALGADDLVRAEAHGLLQAVHDDHVTWKQELREGHRALQEDTADLVRRAEVIRIVDVGIVPGLLQTYEYARYVLLASASVHGSADDIEEAAQVRMRSQQVLFTPGKKIDMLMAESALTQSTAPAEVMVGQIHRIMAALGTPNVRIGILPNWCRLPYMLMHGWWIVDRVVMVETITRERRITEPDEVRTYETLADRLWSVAAEDEEARQLLLASAQQWRAVGDDRSDL